MVSSVVRIPIIAFVFLAACGGDNPVALTGSESRTVVIPAGTPFSVTLGTVGPGAYSSPPTVSSSAVLFVDESEVGPSTPAGPRQRFRFVAVSRGDAVITFTHTDLNPTVQDTIQVR